LRHRRLLSASRQTFAGERRDFARKNYQRDGQPFAEAAHEDTAEPDPDISDQASRGAYLRTAWLVGIEAGLSAASGESAGTGGAYA